jgi:serine/threonine protein kinase
MAMSTEPTRDDPDPVDGGSEHPTLHPTEPFHSPGSRGPELEAPPDQFGRYRIIKSLSGGSMGKVYLAEDTALGRPVAVKTLRFDPRTNPELLIRFLREARALAQFAHPNICPVYDVGETDGVPYLTMPYVDGQSLAERLRGGLSLSQHQAAGLVRTLAAAMAEAHASGIIHRDLKPSNIILDSRGRPVIMDFGLARLMDQTTHLTEVGAPLGTPAYMAPEQAGGAPLEIGPRSDIYSLGVILYQLLTGRVPFEGPATAVLAQVMTEEPMPPRALRPDLDPRLEAICLRAMSKRPEDRFATMRELAHALEGYLGQEQSGTPSTEVESATAQASAAVQDDSAQAVWRQRGSFDWPHFDRPVIMDFGLALQTDETAPITPERNLPPEVESKEWRRTILGCLLTLAVLLLAPVALLVVKWPGPTDPSATTPPTTPWNLLDLLLLYLVVTAGALLGLGVLAWFLRDFVARRRRPSPSGAKPARTPAPAAWKPPEVVGGYRLGELLGRGGSAVVYRGEHVVLGSAAAIKIVPRTAALPPNRLRRALREATLVARLKHPNIVPVLNAGQETDYFFVAMDYVAGGDVARLVQGKPGLPLPRALAIARDVAAALHYVHRHGLVHRDVKPSNILLDGDGRALLSDFGSVKPLEEQAGRLTADGEIVGTPAYMAPEQALGQAITPATDLYGFGCLLFYLVTGRDVFQGPPMALLGQQIHGPPPSPRAINPGAPEALDRLILELLRKKPEERPADMAAVLRGLEAVPTGDGCPAAPASPVPEPEAFQTLAGLPPGREPRADESLFGAQVFAAWGGASCHQTIVPVGPAPGPAAAPAIRLQEARPSAAVDEATKAGRRWQELQNRDEAAAERFWLELPEAVRAAPCLAAPREWYAQRQADQLYARAVDSRRGNQLAEALRLLREALALVPHHREAALLLRELEAVPPVQVDALKALARDGKPQRVPALAALLRRRVRPEDLDDFLRGQPECAGYRDPSNLEEYLFESHGNTRERILDVLFNLRELREILHELGGPAAPGPNKEELIQRILEAIGFRRLVVSEGLDSFLREVTVACRGLEAERDLLKLLGIGTRVFFAAERVVKDLVHFYGHWLHGPEYLDALRRRGWVPAHARSVQRLTLGSLNQSFHGLADEAMAREACRRVFAAGAQLLPGPLAHRLQRLEPHRNQVFSHDSPSTRKLTIPELRTITVEVRDTICDFFDHLRAAEVFPRKLVLDRTVQDRHGQTSYFCLSDRNEEVEVISDCPLEVGRVYLCLSASNPKYVQPVLVPDTTGS